MTLSEAIKVSKTQQGKMNEPEVIAIPVMHKGSSKSKEKPPRNPKPIEIPNPNLNNIPNPNHV